MAIYHQLITFGSSPVAITAGDGTGRATQLYAEPVVGNSADCFVECAGLATGATAATDGVIKVLAKPPAAGSGTITDSWEVAMQKGGNPLFLNQFQFDGTASDKLRLTIYVD